MKKDYVIKNKSENLEFSLNFFQDCLNENFKNDLIQIQSVEYIPSKGENLVFTEKYVEGLTIPIGVQKYYLIYQKNGKKEEAAVIVKSKRDGEFFLDLIAHIYKTTGLDLPLDKIKEVNANLEFALTNNREIDVYKMTNDFPILNQYVAKFYGSYLNKQENAAVLVIEALPDEWLPESMANDKTWNKDKIKACIKAIGSAHAVWYGKTEKLLSRPWFENALNAKRMINFSDFWLALANAAKKASEGLTDFISKEQYQFQLDLIHSIPDWWGEMDKMKKTMIHNDFAPKNIAIDNASYTVKLFDWELATIHIPQRDVCEFLAYVLPENVAKEELVEYIDYHRQIVEDQAKTKITASEWEKGFLYALYDYLLQRLSLSILIEKLEPRNVAKLYRTVMHMIAILSEEK